MTAAPPPEPADPFVGGSGAYYHAYLLWDTAAHACSEFEQHKQTAQALSAVLFSCASVEAFFNELTAQAGQRQDEDAGKALSGALEEVEEARGSARLKFLITILLLTGEPADKGTQPYQDLAVLFRVRDEIVHSKPHRHKFTPDGIEAEPKKLLGTLHGMHLIEDPTQPPARSLFSAISTVALCKWAVETARAVMRYVVERIPDGTLSKLVRTAALGEAP